VVPRKLSPPSIDAVTAVLLTVFVLGVTMGPARWYGHQSHHFPALALVLLLGGTGVLAWRRRFPLTVLLVSAGAVLAYYGLGFSGGPNVIAPALALGTYAFVRGTMRSALAGAMLVGLATVLELVRVGFAEPTLGVAGGFLLGGTAAVAVGSALRARAASLMAARKEAAEASRRRAEEERLTIAREVHDVVAHSLAMINVQAGVGSHVADRRPEQAKRALLEIKEASRTALEDLRETLAVVRGADDRTPAPGLDRLSELIASTGSAGLEVTVDGSAGTLPAHVDAAAYRILQESLTNVVRHAVAAETVTVRIRHHGDGIELTVVDDGRMTTVDTTASGNGLRGMAERARALGGSVIAGQRSRGGFQVQAWLPLTGGAQ
jgi:signal transduction histidine kinase